MSAPAGQGTESQVFRVPIDVDRRAAGSIWAVRDRRGGLPDRGGTRLLASAADHLGLALRREQLAEEATSAEVARRGDALKSALLDPSRTTFARPSRRSAPRPAD